jgi:hypothetical protein
MFECVCVCGGVSPSWFRDETLRRPRDTVVHRQPQCDVDSRVLCRRVGEQKCFLSLPRGNTALACGNSNATQWVLCLCMPSRAHSARGFEITTQTTSVVVMQAKQRVFTQMSSLSLCNVCTTNALLVLLCASYSTYT